MRGMNVQSTPVADMAAREAKIVDRNRLLRGTEGKIENKVVVGETETGVVRKSERNVHTVICSTTMRRAAGKSILTSDPPHFAKNMR